MIHLLRHGHIQDGPRKRFIGQTDPPLSSVGRAQAKSWGDVFLGIDLRLVLCSDLQRSRETARIMVRERADLVRVEPGLREIDLGNWDGREMAAIRASSPREWEKRGQNLAGYRPPGGESFADLALRVIPVFEEIEAAIEGQVLIVGHAGVNRVLLCHVLGMPLENLFRLGQDYGRLNLIRRKEAGYQVQGLNMNRLD